ncbi:MAG: hypothetical protein AB1540_03285 [Bdellovibrionota bacterium]
MIRAFFQSKLYANFWLFILKSACAVGLSSSLAVTIPTVVVSRSFDLPVEMPVSVFFVGAAYGFVLSIVGFWVVFALLRLKLRVPFNALVLLVGVSLAVVALVHFSLAFSGEAMSMPLNVAIFFPVAPALISLYFFVKFCRAHLKPFV